MFEEFFMSVMERLYGRKISTLIIQTGVIPERALRSWMDGTSKPDQRRLDEFSERTSTWLHRHINGRTHWPDEWRTSYLEEIAANVGGASSLVHLVHWQGEGLVPPPSTSRADQ